MLIGVGCIVPRSSPSTQQVGPALGQLADKELSANLEIPLIDVSAGFSGTNLNYALAPGSADLPEGLNLEGAKGHITGTPIQSAAPRMLRIRATNNGGYSDGTFSMSVLTPTIERNADNTLSVTTGADGGPVEITLTNDSFNGTYTLDPSALPAVLEGTSISNTHAPQDNSVGVVGDMFEAHMPLTVYDKAGVQPTVSGQWYLDGVALPQATNPTLIAPAEGVLDFRAETEALNMVSNPATISTSPPVATLEGLVGGPTPNVVPNTTRTLHAAVPLGPAFASRTLYVVALMRRTNIMGIEITPDGGQTYAMQSVAQAVADNGADMIAVYKAQIALGDSADIELISDTSSPTGRSSVAVYAARDVTSEGTCTKIEAAQAQGNTVDNLTFETTGAGFVLAAGFGINVVAYNGWAGATQDGAVMIQSISPFSVASGPLPTTPGTHTLGYGVVNDLGRVALALAIS